MMAYDECASVQEDGLCAVWEGLERYGKRVSFARRTLIYTPQKSAHTLYLLCSGQVSLSILSSGGRVLTLQVLGARDMFGHSTLAGNDRYDTFAEATQPSEAIAVSRRDVLRALAQEPRFGLALIHELRCYLLLLSKRLDETAFKSLPARLASILLDMADTCEQRQYLDALDSFRHLGPLQQLGDVSGQVSGGSTGKGPVRLPRRTHQQLADMTNAYRETVTKVIGEFRADGLLEIDRSGITLLNTWRLRELAQG